MFDHTRGARAQRTISDATSVSRSGRAWICGVLAAAGVALVVAAPAGAEPTRTKDPGAVPPELIDPQVAMFRPCGSSPHGTRLHIVDPLSGRTSVIECVNGTWVPVS